MLLDSSIYIGVFCNKCSKYEILEASLFMLKKDEELKINILCSDEYITIKTYDFRTFYFSVFCCSCNTRHTYRYSLSEVLSNNLVEFKCELTKLDILYVGNQRNIEDTINKANKRINDIIHKCGFDEHIKNPYIMMKILDKIHDIAEKRNLSCDCGGEVIGVNLFSDRVELKCLKCGSLNAIYAETNEDYLNILKRSIIVLHESSFTCLDAMYF